MESGYILHETSAIVIIATLKSENEKTGDMIQIWILNRAESPVDSVKHGTDSNVCFDCVHRGTSFADRTCYVNVIQGPGSVWRAYVAGSYRLLARSEYSAVFANRAVRFGAYGDPVLIPIRIVRAIVRVATKHTGYTHQWRKAEFQIFRSFFMASCDSIGDYAAAKRMGWRTFRVRTRNGSVLAHEIICPASDEAGHKTQCIRCGLCSGSRSNDTRKDIVIIVHGIRKQNFIQLEGVK